VIYNKDVPNKTKRKTVKKVAASDGETPVRVDSRESTDSCSWCGKFSSANLRKIIIFFLTILVVLALLGYYFKDKFIVSIVNGKPIFRSQLNQRLISSFGGETLENMIVEKLIKAEIAKQGVQAKEEEVDSELNKIAESLGNQAKIEDVLSSQGISMKDFRSQLQMRLEVNKIMEKEITISDSEVDQFVEDNGPILIATGEAERKVEAKARIREQKINEKVQQWVSDLLAQAKISRFLK